MHGKGIMTLSNGEKFEGTFVEGMIDGYGKFTSIDYKVTTGIWKEGILMSWFLIYYYLWTFFINKKK